MQSNFLSSGEVTRPANRQTAVAIPGQHRAAGENAIPSGGARADSPRQRKIFVAAQAIKVVVVHHADDRAARSRERLEHVDVRHFVNINGVRLEPIQRVGSNGGRIAGQGKGFGEDIAPGIFAMPGRCPMQQANRMAALFQFRSRELRVDFSARHGPEPIMNKQQSHRGALILARTAARCNWGVLPLGSLNR